MWGGDANSVPLTVSAPAGLTLQVDSRANMKVVVAYDGPVKAPIAQGQRIATLHVTAPDFPGMDVPLVAAQAVPETGFFGRMMLGLHAILSGKK